MSGWRSAAPGLFLVDEPGHKSESLVAAWRLPRRGLPAEVRGDPERDAEAVLAALAAGGVRPDGVLTFWEAECRVSRPRCPRPRPAGQPDRRRSTKRTTARFVLASSLPARPAHPARQRVRSLTSCSSALCRRQARVRARAAGCVRSTTRSLPASTRRAPYRYRARRHLPAGNHLLLEEYLDGVEFDVDLVMRLQRPRRNWPTASPRSRRPACTARPITIARRFAASCSRGRGPGFGLDRRSHVEAKSTSRGPRIEVNARMGRRRVHEFVGPGVDLSRPPFVDGPGRDRTCDLGIKSPLLYQLSYRPRGEYRLGIPRPQRSFSSSRRSA